MTGQDRRRQPDAAGTGKPPAYVAEIWVSAQLRERIQRVLASGHADDSRARETDRLPQPDLEAEL